MNDNPIDQDTDHKVDEAVQLLRESAEAHEKENEGDFCESTRALMVVYVMLSLGLDLLSLGVIADMLAEALVMNEENLEQEAEDDAVLQSGEVS